MAKCHNMGLFLSSHMAMVLPSASPDIPFPGKPRTHMGALCLSVYITRRGKINTYTFPWKQLFVITQNMKTIFFSVGRLLPLVFTHLPCNRSRNSLISGICGSCQGKLSGVRHHDLLKGLMACALWSWNFIAQEIKWSILLHVDRMAIWCQFGESHIQTVRHIQSMNGPRISSDRHFQ